MFFKLVVGLFTLGNVFAKTLPKDHINVTFDCTVTEYDQVEWIASNCRDILVTDLKVPANKQLLFNLQDGASLTFRGTIIFDEGTLDGWLMEISGNGITVKGEKDSLIHGNGQQYWDGQGGNGGKVKPKLLTINKVNNGVFKNINLKNCPMFCTGITSSNYVSIEGWRADCSEGDKKGAKNTDGIGIADSTNIQINNAFVHNQDQCLYVNHGSDMIFTNIHCVNSNGMCATAGFSADSYEVNTIKNITFKDSVLEGGLTGVQIIAMSQGGPGEITDVTFNNILLKGVKQQGIYVQMDYGGKINNNIAVNNFKVENVHGTVEANAKAVNIVCGAKCNKLEFSGINIIGSRVPNTCNYQPIGFHC